MFLFFLSIFFFVDIFILFLYFLFFTSFFLSFSYLFIYTHSPSTQTHHKHIQSRRITLFECPNDINSMIDICKVADLVLMMIDASFGFEMELFELLNVLQTHGMPKVMGILTHLDLFKKQKQIRKVCFIPPLCYSPPSLPPSLSPPSPSLSHSPLPSPSF